MEWLLWVSIGLNILNYIWIVKTRKFANKSRKALKDLAVAQFKTVSKVNEIIDAGKEAAEAIQALNELWEKQEITIDKLDMALHLLAAQNKNTIN